ncbi:fibroblast growth factor receptor 3-like isoform X2 [Oculina patagonica]
MMANISWLECRRYYLLLLLVASGLSILPPASCQYCNTKAVEPRIKISSTPSSNKQPVGAAINLTCTAWKTDELAMEDLRTRPHKIEWFDTQDVEPVKECLAGSPAAALMSCTLTIGVLTEEKFGNYTCKANNDYYHCSNKIFPIILQDIERPVIVKDPVSQGAVIGSNVTFNCTATGYPKPTITWKKDNDSHSIQAKVITDDEKTLSQLVITGVTRENYDKYQCVANNSAGVNTSRAAILHQEAEGKKSKVVSVYSGAEAPSTFRMPQSAIQKIIAFTVSGCIIIVLLIIGFLWHRGCVSKKVLMAQCIFRIKTYDRENPEPSETYNRSSQKENQQENTYDYIDDQSYASSMAPENEKVQFSSHKSEESPLLDTLRVDLPARKPPQARPLPPTPEVDDAGTKMEWNSAQNLMCSSVLQFGSQNVDFESQETEEDYEIDLKRLEIQDVVLGQGEFGIVYKGSYHCEDEKVINVAVKQLKDNTSVSDKVALLSEIQMLKLAGRHPNIVNLVGACTQDEKILLVTEFVPGGSLEALLIRKHAPGENSEYENVNCVLNNRQLVNIALQIASGMQHLERKKCIHGDLAARNVFIDHNKIAKIGDFGLARDISDRGIYTKTSNGKVPWRWLSLESLRDVVYTTQSDVWSFGILLWEIATYGEVPYPDITTPVALKSFLSSGNRMPCPKHCSEELYALMQSCWMENPFMRPTFNDITKQIKYLLREVKKS